MFLLFRYPYLKFLFSRLLQKHRKYHGFGLVCGLPNLLSAYVRARAARARAPNESVFGGVFGARARGARVCQQNTVQQQQQQQQQQHQHQQQQQQQQQQRTHTLFPGTAGGCVSSWINVSSKNTPRRIVHNQNAPPPPQKKKKRGCDNLPRNMGLTRGTWGFFHEIRNSIFWVWSEVEVKWLGFRQCSKMNLMINFCKIRKSPQKDLLLSLILIYLISIKFYDSTRGFLTQDGPLLDFLRALYYEQQS